MFSHLYVVYTNISLLLGRQSQSQFGDSCLMPVFPRLTIGNPYGWGNKCLLGFVFIFLAALHVMINASYFWPRQFASWN